MTETVEAKHTPGPYAVYPSGSLFVLRDNRTGALASYPTTKKAARHQAAYMNEQYAKLVAEDAALAKAEAR